MKLNTLTPQELEQLKIDIMIDITNLKYVKQLIDHTDWKFKKPVGANVAINTRLIANRALLVKILYKQKGGES